MVHKCVVTKCSTGYKTGRKKASFHFSEAQELKRNWIYFVNRKDWSSTAHLHICIDHFEEKNIKRGKKCKLLWQLHQVLTIHNDSKSSPSLIRTPTIPRKFPRNRKIGLNELVLFQAADEIVDIRIHLKTAPLKTSP